MSALVSVVMAMKRQSRRRKKVLEWKLKKSYTMVLGCRELVVVVDLKSDKIYHRDISLLLVYTQSTCKQRELPGTQVPLVL